jgi:hypothetical protein
MMSRSTTARVTGLASAALALMLVVGLAGCSGSKSSSTETPPTVTGSTAKGSLPAAQSALSTMAPDAKLLLVTTAGIVTTAPPVWQYLFGSPKSGKTYSVNMMGGNALPQEYGSAGLTPDEWAAVPGLDKWKIDSDVAVQKARSVYTAAGGDDSAYILGMVTYVPKSATKTTSKALVWSVSFDPSKRGKAPTPTVEVNAETGVAAFPK